MITVVDIPPGQPGDPDEPLVRLPRDEFLRENIPEWTENFGTALEISSRSSQEQWRQRGIEALAEYRSFRHGNKWGIVIRRSGVRGLGHRLHLETGLPLNRCLKAAFRALYEHELFHFQVDCGYLRLESVGIQSIGAKERTGYGDLYGLSRKLFQPWDQLEEALANARSISRSKREFRAALKSAFQECPPGYRDFGQFRTGAAFQKGLDALFNLSEPILDRKVAASGVGRVIDPNDSEINGQHVPVYLRLD